MESELMMQDCGIKVFDPRILLGDRLGLVLYTWCASEYLKTRTRDHEAFRLYEKFIRYFREHKEHSVEKFLSLIDQIREKGFSPSALVEGNPEEYSLYDGSHRSAAAIALGIENVPYSLKWEDRGVAEKTFPKIFSATELEQLLDYREQVFSTLPRQLAFRCRLRRMIRFHTDSFQAAFSSKNSIQALRPYQGLESENILGKRPTLARFRHYGLEKHLRPSMDVLDIGCNVGFFSLLLSQKVNQLTGLDVDEAYLKAARLGAEFLNARNTKFVQTEIREYRQSAAFDFIVSCAVHGWIKMEFDIYLQFLKRILRPNGLILFESHEILAEKDWKEKRAKLENEFRIVDFGYIDDVDSRLYQSEVREFLILQNKS